MQCWMPGGVCGDSQARAPVPTQFSISGLFSYSRLDRGGQLVYAAEEHAGLPDVLVVGHLAPGGHAGPAHAVFDGVKDVPLVVVQGLQDELRRGRIQGPSHVTRLFGHGAMAEGAIHGVELHAINQVGVGGGNGTLHMGSVLLHGSINGVRGQPRLGSARRLVGVGIDEAGKRKHQPAHDDDDDDDNHAQDKVAHAPSCEWHPTLAECFTAPKVTSVRLEAARLTNHVRDLGQKVVFQRRRERHRRVTRDDAHDGSVQVIEDFFIYDGGNFSSDAAGARVLVQDNDLVGVAHRGGNGLAIQRQQGAQVHNFKLNPFFGQNFRRFQRDVQHGGVGDDAQVTTWPRHARLAQRHDVILRRQVLLDAPVKHFVLEENDRVVVANGGFDQPFGIVSRARADHLETGGVHEVHFRVLRMERAAVNAPAAGPPDHDRSGRAPAVVRLGQHVGDLVEGATDEIHELELGHGTQPGERGPEGGAHDGGLSDGSINYALRAKTLDEAVGDLESAAVDADVLAQAEDTGVPLHLLPDALADSFEIGGGRHKFIRRGSTRRNADQTILQG